jgi:hypothetical protein
MALLYWILIQRCDAPSIRMLPEYSDDTRLKIAAVSRTSTPPTGESPNRGISQLSGESTGAGGGAGVWGWGAGLAPLWQIT